MGVCKQKGRNASPRAAFFVLKISMRFSVLKILSRTMCRSTSAATAWMPWSGEDLGLCAPMRTST